MGWLSMEVAVVYNTITLAQVYINYKQHIRPFLPGVFSQHHNLSPIRYVYGNELSAINEMKYCRMLSGCYDLLLHDNTNCYLYEILHNLHMA